MNSSDRTFNPAEVLGRAFDPRHEVLELTLEVTADASRLFATLEAQHLSAVRAWARRQDLEPLLTVLEPRPGWVKEQHFLRSSPQSGAAVVTEVLLGEEVGVLDTVVETALERQHTPQNTWVRVRTQRDAYLGWLPQACVTSTPYKPTHAVTALRAHAYAEPKVQAPPVATLSWGSHLAVVQNPGQEVAEADDEWTCVSLPGGRHGFVGNTLLRAASDLPARPVLETWPEFLGVPYLWGGGSAWGLDCSGLVQLLHRMAGQELPRDADEQFQMGEPISLEAARPGDVVAFKGHIGLYLGEGRMVHANAANMAVTVDDFMAQPYLRSIFLGFVRYTSPENAKGR